MHWVLHDMQIPTSKQGAGESYKTVEQLISLQSNALSLVKFDSSLRCTALLLTVFHIITHTVLFITGNTIDLCLLPGSAFIWEEP